MTALVLTHQNLGSVKRTLVESFPNMKSSHLTEALASALGCRTHASLLDRLKQSDPADPEFALLDEERFLARIQEFGYQPSQDDLTFGPFFCLNEDGVGLVNTTPFSGFEITYTTPHEKVWRNLMVAAINAGLQQKLFGLRPGDNRWLGHDNQQRDAFVFSFDFPDGTPALGSVRDAGHDELSIHAVLEPTADGARWIKCSNAGFSAGNAFASGWLERRRGAWLQTNIDSFRCRRHVTEKAAAIEITPRGFGDRGAIIL